MKIKASKRVKEIQELHKRVQAQIEKAMNATEVKEKRHQKQALFQLNDLVWVQLRKKRFPCKRKSKLMLSADGSFEVLWTL